MTNSKTKKMIALLALGAVATTAAATGIALNRNGIAVFADAVSSAEDSAIVGSEENPALAIAGENTISDMVVGGNAEMGYKELVYYMSFTPANSGVYTFTHSNPDVGVADINSDYDYPYGDWNDGWDVFSVELTADVTYTVLINNFDWTVDLTDYEVGDTYTLASPETITIVNTSVAAGSSRDNALAYNVGDTIIVPQGHDPVWYSFVGNSEENYYVIVNSGSAAVRKNLKTTTITNGYVLYSGSGTYYICATPTDTAAAEVKVLVAEKQSEGSCIVTAVELPADRVVGDNNWYTYTVGEEDETVSVNPTADAYVVVEEHEDEDGNLVTTEYVLSGSVDVYDGYTFVGSISDEASLTLEAGKTYHFYAPAYVYEESDEEGNIILSVNVQSLIVID